MEFTYTLEPMDLMIYEKFAAKRKSKFSNIIFPVVGIVVIVNLFLPFIHTFYQRANHLPYHMDWNALILTVLLPIAVFCIAWFGLSWWSKREQWKSPLCQFPQTLSIANEGLAWEHQQTRTTILWSGIKEISSDENAVYFITEQQTAYLIPRKIFSSADASNTFFKMAVAYWKNELLPNTEAKSVWPPAPRVGSSVAENEAKTVWPPSPKI